MNPSFSEFTHVAQQFQTFGISKTSGDGLINNFMADKKLNAADVFIFNIKQYISNFHIIITPQLLLKM